MTGTTVLTVAPLGGHDMSDWCGGWARRAGHTVIPVPSSADLTLRSIPDAAEQLELLAHQVLASSEDDVVVLAHSQGCQVAGMWLANYANADPSRLSFILTGNLERAYFGYAANKVSWIPKGNIRGLTPNDTAFRVLDIGRERDAWANFPGGLWAMLRLPFSPAHLNYDSVDPDNLEPLSSKVVGHTTYVTVP